MWRNRTDFIDCTSPIYLPIFLSIYFYSTVLTVWTKRTITLCLNNQNIFSIWENIKELFWVWDLAKFKNRVCDKKCKKSFKFRKLEKKVKMVKRSKQNYMNFNIGPSSRMVNSTRLCLYGYLCSTKGTKKLQSPKIGSFEKIVFYQRNLKTIYATPDCLKKIFVPINATPDCLRKIVFHQRNLKTIYATPDCLKKSFVLINATPDCLR
jgi:hypothetical protein